MLPEFHGVAPQPPGRPKCGLGPQAVGEHIQVVENALLATLREDVLQHREIAQLLDQTPVLPRLGIQLLQPGLNASFPLFPGWALEQIVNVHPQRARIDRRGLLDSQLL